MDTAKRFGSRPALADSGGAKVTWSEALVKTMFLTGRLEPVWRGQEKVGILVPPSVLLVLYAMIARQPVGQLWLAGVIPGILMATVFIFYIVIRCKLNPSLGPVLSPEERDIPRAEKLRLLRAGLLPLVIFFVMMVPFVNGWTSLVESSAIGAIAAFMAGDLKIAEVVDVPHMLVTMHLAKSIFDDA